MKYLRKFATKADMADLEQPNVVLIGDTSEVLYNAVPNGVYIQHIDGKLYTTEDWSAKGFVNDEANGVAVVDEKASFVIAKIGNPLTQWGAQGFIDGVASVSSPSFASGDYNGIKNTSIIAAAYADSAAYQCENYTFPSGAKGYLPAGGEMKIAAKKSSEIENAMSIIGGESLYGVGTSYYKGKIWTSTQCNSDPFAVYMEWSTGSLSEANKILAMASRAFAPLNI